MTLTKTSDVGFCLCIDVMFHNSISYPFTCQHRMFVHRVLRSRCAAFDCVVKNRCAAQAISFSCVNFALYIFQPKNIIHDLCEHENMINLTVWLALSFVVIFETGAARNRKDIIRNFFDHISTIIPHFICFKLVKQAFENLSLIHLYFLLFQNF